MKYSKTKNLADSGPQCLVDSTTQMQNDVGLLMIVSINVLL